MNATDPAPNADAMPWWLRLSARLPLNLLYALATWASLLLRHVLRYRLGVVRSNLRRCFPDLAPAAIDAIASRYYRRIGQVAVECLKLASFSAEEMRQRVRMPNVQLVRAELQAGRSIILLAAHLGNWEWQLQGAVVHLGVPIDAAYKPLHRAGPDRALLALRSHFGARMVAAKKLPRAVARHRDQVRAIALMADQIPMSSGGRYWLSFFGCSTAFYPGPAEIARATGYAVFFASMRRTARGRYEVWFEPMTAAGEPLEPEAFTARYAQLLEAQIRADPPNWLWSHRRWKLTPPAPIASSDPTSA